MECADSGRSIVPSFVAQFPSSLSFSALSHLPHHQPNRTFKFLFSALPALSSSLSYRPNTQPQNHKPTHIQ